MKPSWGKCLLWGFVASSAAAGIFRALESVEKYGWKLMFDILFLAVILGALRYLFVRSTPAAKSTDVLK